MLPFESSSTVKRRLDEKLDIQRQDLIQELALTCKSIAFSIDIWTSKNNLPILAIIGHWLTVTAEQDVIQKHVRFVGLAGLLQANPECILQG